MYKLFVIAFFIGCINVAAQPRAVLDAGGFAPVEIELPANDTEKLVELSKNWAADINRREGSYDVTEVTTSSLTISAYKKNAFFYRSRGEAYDYKIRYEMKIDFKQNSYSVTFRVMDIFAENDVVVQSGLGGYFTSAGALKEGFDEVKPSLETTVNNIIKSHYNFILNYR